MSSRRDPAQPLVLAIDIGTSSVRALAYDQRLRAVPGAASHRPYRPRMTASGGAEIDGARLVKLVVDAVDAALEAAGPRAEFVAVGVSSFWHAVLAVEGTRPATPALLWSDGRSWREAERLRTALDEDAVHRRTGCRLHPSYWPAKIRWLKRHDTRLRRAAIRWVSPVDLLYATLFGTLATSPSLASGTGLYGLRRPAWDGEVLEAIGISDGQLPEVSDAAWTGLRPAWARRWPRLARVPWAAAGGDGALANLGSGCLDRTRRAVTIGTSAALRVAVDRPPARLPLPLWCYRSPQGGYLVGGALSGGGNLYRWLVETLAVGDVRTLPRRLARLNPAAHGLTMVPLLAGERSPGYAPRAAAGLAGLTQATTSEELVQAGLEAVALELARVDRALDRVVPGAVLLVASGAGLLADRPWMRILCDAIGKPLAPSRAAEASARGAALTGLRAAGVVPGGADLRRWDPGTRGTLQPTADPAVRRRYREALARQEALYRALAAGGLLERSEPAAPAHLTPVARSGRMRQME